MSQKVSGISFASKPSPFLVCPRKRMGISAKLKAYSPFERTKKNEKEKENSGKKREKARA